MADHFVNARLDAENKAIILEVVDADGALVTDWGAISIKLGKDPETTPSQPGHAMGQPLDIYETVGCDAEGNPQYCMMLRSPWYSTPKTSNPET